MLKVDNIGATIINYTLDSTRHPSNRPRPGELFRMWGYIQEIIPRIAKAKSWEKTSQAPLVSKKEFKAKVNEAKKECEDYMKTNDNKLMGKMPAEVARALYEMGKREGREQILHQQTVRAFIFDQAKNQSKRAQNSAAFNNADGDVQLLKPYLQALKTREKQTPQSKRTYKPLHTLKNDDDQTLLDVANATSNIAVISYLLKGNKEDEYDNAAARSAYPYTLPVVQKALAILSAAGDREAQKTLLSLLSPKKKLAQPQSLDTIKKRGGNTIYNLESTEFTTMPEGLKVRQETAPNPGKSNRATPSKPPTKASDNTLLIVGLVIGLAAIIISPILLYTPTAEDETTTP